MPTSVPTTAAQATASEDASGDRFYDLSLRILMAVVSVGLVGSVAFLTYRWAAPRPSVPAHVPLTEVGVKPLPAATPSAPPAPKGEVLMAPGQIFKCDVKGRITFSEQPCAAAAAAASAAGAEKKAETGPAKAAPPR
jgi:hypothetical protein